MHTGRFSRFVSAVLLTTLLCTAVLRAANQQGVRYVTVAEETLRGYAVDVVMPLYPQRARRRNVQGTAVVQLGVNEQGTVTSVEVLEAPDALTRESVAQAVRQWRFKSPTIHGQAVSLRGKLTFYYVIRNGKGQVENPRQFK